MKQFILSLGAILLILGAQAQTINLMSFATGFSDPIGIEFAPGDNRPYVVQQKGKIRIVNTNGTVVGTDYIDLSSIVEQSGGERGLLGLAFHPDYVNNGYFYVNYIRATDGNTRISRFTRNSGNPNIADIGSEHVILDITQAPYTNHKGGCLRFGPDGFLYLGTGDGGNGGDPGNRAQNPLELLGKMLRIDINAGTYQIPAGNPYYGQTDTLPEIWAMGMRNPWRFSFDKLSGDLWIADVGQGNWEEIDFQTAGIIGGKNYGWRCYEGNNAYNTNGCQPQSFYEPPVAAYSHSGGNCSVTGGFRYRGAQEGDLYGKYLYVDYCTGTFRETHLIGTNVWTTNVLNTSAGSNFTTFGEGPDGELYIANAANGTIYSITTPTCMPSAGVWGENGANSFCINDSLLLSAPVAPGFSYQWIRNGAGIAGASSSTYYAKQAGSYKVKVTNTTACSDTSDAFAVTVINCTTGIQQQQTAISSLNLYPNPATDAVILQVQAARPMQVTCRLMSVDGKRLMDLSYPVQTGNNVKELSLKGLAAGLYQIQVIDGESASVRSLIIAE